MNTAPLFSLFVFLLPLLAVFVLATTTSPEYQPAETNNLLHQTCGPYNKSYNPITAIPDPIFYSFLANLTSAANCTGYATSFLNKTIGNKTYSPTEGIHALAQCREDLFQAGNDTNTNLCTNCLTEAMSYLKSNCRDRSDTLIIYENCLIRYRNTSFIGVVEASSPLVVYSSPDHIENINATVFETKLGLLMRKVKTLAIAPGSKGLGKSKIPLDEFVTLYGLGQCTLDLSKMKCRSCLDKAINAMGYNGTCKDKLGCQVMSSSCYVRYETYTFFYPLD